MDEDLEQELAELVAGLTPEEYEKFAPALHEAGLAVAELRVVQRDFQSARTAYLDGLNALTQADQDMVQAAYDMDRAMERARNALRLAKRLSSE